MTKADPSFLLDCAAAIERAAGATTPDEWRSPRQPALLDVAEQIGLRVTDSSGSYRCSGYGISAQRSDGDGHGHAVRAWARNVEDAFGQRAAE